MTKPDTVKDWLDLIERRYPARTAAPWDNSGLQVGDPTWPVARVLVALDVTQAVLDEASQVAHTLLIAHHPLLFAPLRTLTPDTASGRLALTAAQHQIAVVAAHTNLDVAKDGTSTSAPLANLLALTDTQPLTGTATQTATLKLVTFVPDAAITAVRDALTMAGAGTIGAYSACSFVTPGTGTFRPSQHANPAVPTPADTDTTVAEQRLEMVVPRHRLAAVIDALNATHPYEEVAYDVYERVEPHEQFGLIGTLPVPSTIGAIATKVAEELPAPHLRVAGDPDTVVSRVAVCGGAGDSLIPQALAGGAELYLTGDLKHHVTLDALTLGLSLIDVGHHASEVAALPAFIRVLGDDAARQGLGAPVLASQINTSPWS